jgi:Tfp pilus assembly protein PilV
MSIPSIPRTQGIFHAITKPQEFVQNRCNPISIRLRARGFALVATLCLMILLTVIALGMLSLSSISLRSNSQANAQAAAQANARLALMIAIGELQKEMGPDMRVTAKSAIFDQNPDTETIEGVHQSHWLASYESWGQPPFPLPRAAIQCILRLG